MGRTLRGTVIKSLKSRNSKCPECFNPNIRPDAFYRWLLVVVPQTQWFEESQQGIIHPTKGRQAALWLMSVAGDWASDASDWAGVRYRWFESICNVVFTCRGWARIYRLLWLSRDAIYRAASGEQRVAGKRPRLLHIVDIVPGHHPQPSHHFIPKQNACSPNPTR